MLWVGLIHRLRVNHELNQVPGFFQKHQTTKMEAPQENVEKPQQDPLCVPPPKSPSFLIKMSPVKR